MRTGGAGTGSDASDIPTISRRIPPKRFELSSVKLFQVTRDQHHMETSEISSLAIMLRDGSHDDVSIPQCGALRQNFSAKHFGEENQFQEDTSSLQNRCQSIPTLSNHLNLADQEVVPVLDRGGTVPARGLCNIGNTCYQNAIVQTLYFNGDLRSYLDLQHSRGSASAQNLDRSGKVTKTLSELISNMVSGSNIFISQHKFKSMVDSHMAQFHGRQQHDAQEFLLSLLNQLQEEACLPPAPETSRSHLPKVQSSSVPIVAHCTGGFAEQSSAGPQQQRATQPISTIAEMFHGSFCSQLHCPECEYCSATFEPFTCLSLPIPKLDIHTIQVSIIFRRKTALFSRTGSRQTFHINQSMAVKDLRAIVAKEMGMGPRDVILCEMVRSGFGVLLKDTAPASEICGCHDLYAFEAPPFHGAPDQQPILLVVTNIVTNSAESGRRFGLPVVLRVRRNLTHTQFQSVLLHSMRNNLRDSSQDLQDRIRTSTLFQCQVVTNNNLVGLGWLEDEGKGLFAHPSVQAGLLEAAEHRLTPHVRVIAVWTAHNRDSTFKAVVPDTLLPAPFNMATVKRREAYALTATLQDCIQQYIQEERLNDADWKCPNCSHTQHNVVKKLDFHTLPKTLMISIKRFDQTYDSASGKIVESKLGTLVDFPVHCLDMTPYLSQAAASRGRPSEADQAAQDGKELEKPSKQKTVKLNGKKLWSKIKGARGWGKKSTCGVASPATVDVDSHSQTGDVPATSSAGNDSVTSFTSADKYKYDLYAVVNHYGGLSSGHYTATCRNISDVNRKWHYLDDNMVSAALEGNLKTRNAYILCYTQREAGRERARSLQPSTCHKRINSPISCCTDYDVGDTSHFTIDAYSVSDTESWKSVTSLAHRIKVDCCPPAPQQPHATTTPPPSLQFEHHTRCPVDLGRATGLNFGEAAGVQRNGGRGMMEMEGSSESTESTSQFNVLSSSAQDLQQGPAQPSNHQQAELRSSKLIGPCLDAVAPPSTLTAEGGEYPVTSASPPKVAWLSDSSTHNLLRDKLLPHEVQQSSRDKGTLTLQPHCPERSATSVEP